MKIVHKEMALTQLLVRLSFGFLIITLLLAKPIVAQENDSLELSKGVTFICNDIYFRYHPNQKKGAEPDILYLEYEPILARTFGRWSLGLKSRFFYEGSKHHYFSANGYGIGSYVRFTPSVEWFPKRKSLPNFNSKNIKQAIANTYFGLGLEKSNIYLDSNRNENVKDLRFDQSIAAFTIGTFVPIFKWLRLELDSQYEWFFQEGNIVFNGIRYVSDLNIRFTFVF